MIDDEKFHHTFSIILTIFSSAEEKNVKTFLLLLKLEYNINPIFSSSFSYLMKIVRTVPVVQ